MKRRKTPNKYVPTHTKHSKINWCKLGRLTAAILLLPAFVTALCTVQHNMRITVPALIVALWCEYRLGFLRY